MELKSSPVYLTPEGLYILHGLTDSLEFCLLRDAAEYGELEELNELCDGVTEEQLWSRAEFPFLLCHEDFMMELDIEAERIEGLSDEEMIEESHRNGTTDDEVFRNMEEVIHTIVVPHLWFRPEYPPMLCEEELRTAKHILIVGIKKDHPRMTGIFDDSTNQEDFNDV